MAYCRYALFDSSSFTKSIHQKLFKCLFTIYQRAKLLQAQGAKEDNNQEFAQIMQFLKNLQMQSKMQQQRQSMPGAPPPQQSSPQNALPTGTVH
jgi:ATP-dependent helicase STH1/SNF2